MRTAWLKYPVPSLRANKDTFLLLEDTKLAASGLPGHWNLVHGVDHPVGGVLDRHLDCERKVGVSSLFALSCLLKKSEMKIR